MNETVLIVDDEEPVRQTFQEWLAGSDVDCTLLAAADAEQALVLANQQPIDLAILDWNLGAGADGLKLLEDLYLFHPDIVAIMITGYAHQATPLDAMRMGVRDYLDKNQDLDRDTFLNAVRKQLGYIRPAKRQRHVHQGLLAFREAVDQVVPLVQSAAALNDPVPLSAGVRGLIRFLLRTTRARAGVLIARRYLAAQTPPELVQVYDAEGEKLDLPLVPFARSAAASALSFQAPCVMNDLPKLAQEGSVELQPFEIDRSSLLAAPMDVAPGIQVVLELFDKEGADGFSAEDQRLVAATAGFGVELLRQALAERQTSQLLLDAISAALKASESVTQTLEGKTDTPAPAVLDQVRAGLEAATGKDAHTMIELAEAIRALASRHGEPALEHCRRLVVELRWLLDEVTGVKN